MFVIIDIITSILFSIAISMLLAHLTVMFIRYLCRLACKIDCNDVEKFLDIDIEDDDVDTLGGYLIKKLDRIPKDGEKPVVETEKITYKIEKVQDRKIIKVKACKNI